MKTKKLKHRASVTQSAEAKHTTTNSKAEKEISKAENVEEEKKMNIIYSSNCNNFNSSINKELHQQKEEEHQDDTVQEETSKCTLSLEELSKIFDKVEFNFLTGNTLPNSRQQYNNSNGDNENKNNRNSLLYPRDLGNLILWSVPSPVPLIESPHKFFIKNKSKLRNVLMIYVNNKIILNDVDIGEAKCSVMTDNNNNTETIKTIQKTHTVNTQGAKRNFDCGVFISHNIPHLPLLTYPSTSSSSLSASSSSEKTSNKPNSDKRTNRFIQELFWRSSKPKTIIDYSGRSKNNNNNNKQQEHSTNSNVNTEHHVHDLQHNKDSATKTNETKNINKKKSNKQHDKATSISNETATSMNGSSELGIGAHSLFKRAREIHACMTSNPSSPTSQQQEQQHDNEMEVKKQSDNAESENSELCKVDSITEITKKNDVGEISTDVLPDNVNERREEGKEIEEEWKSVWGNVNLLKSYALHWPEHEHELLSLGYTLSAEHNWEEQKDKSSSESSKNDLEEKLQETTTCKSKWMCLSSNAAKYSVNDDDEEKHQENKNETENTNSTDSSINDSKEDVSDENHDDNRRFGVFALDCEMVLTTGYVSSLARITLIDVMTQTVLFDELVKPKDTVVNYLTRYSGVTHNDLVNVSTTLHDIQTRLKELFESYSECFIVGHSLENDFKALYWLPREVYILDTAFLYPHHCQLPLKNSLKWLAIKYLHTHIQHSAHDSAEDALISAKLAFLKLQNGPSFGVSNVHKYSVLQLVKDGLQNNSHYHQNDNNSCNDKSKNEKSLNVVIKLFDDATVLQHILPSQTSSPSNATITKPNSCCTDEGITNSNETTLKEDKTENVCDKDSGMSKSKFVIDCIATRNDEDATRKCIRALKQINKSNESFDGLQSCVEDDTYHLMWVQLSEPEQYVLEKDKEGKESKLEVNKNVEGAMNERVKRIVEAAPIQTLVLLLVSEFYCSNNNNSNTDEMHTNSPTPYLKTQGACFAFVKDESIDFDSNSDQSSVNIDKTEVNNNSRKNIKADATETETENTELPTPSGCQHQEEESFE